MGRLGTAPRDALAWADLAEVECRLGERETARLCAEAAACLAPRDTRIRRVRAMVLLRLPEWGERGRHELGELEGGPGLGRPGEAGGACRAPSGAG